MQKSYFSTFNCYLSISGYQSRDILRPLLHIPQALNSVDQELSEETRLKFYVSYKYTTFHAKFIASF